MVSLLSRDLSFGGSDVGGDALVPLQIQDDADVNGRFTPRRAYRPGLSTLRVNTRPGISIPFERDRPKDLPRLPFCRQLKPR
jgi:hypothetical protein